MSQFPEEILTKILSQLSARELWGLRCVSKSWCALIDSPFFINLHLSHSTQTNSNRTLVLFNGSETFYLHVDDLLDHDGNRKPNCPLKSWPRSVLLGSCNGLLLVCEGYSRGENNFPCTGNCMKDFVIWNPNTGEYKSLPDPLPLPGHIKNYHDFPTYLSTGYYVNHVYGFAYDSTKDDYKVVRVNQSICSDKLKHCDEADIYSLKSKTWRRIECLSLPLHIKFNQLCGAFTSGALHWAGKKIHNSIILAFDFGAEEFRVLAQPDYSVEARSIRMEELDGKLCLSSLGGGFVDIWIMMDYGVKESWTKLLSISLSPPLFVSWYMRPYVDPPYTRPLAHSSFGNKILLNQLDGTFILYDLARHTKEEIRIVGLDGFFVAYSCVDSLVWLGEYDRTVINSQNSHEEKNANTKRRCISLSANRVSSSRDNDI